MNSVLFIIEAPGKMPILKKILDELSVGNTDVIATMGRLYDFPKEKLGLDLENLSSSKVIPLRPKVVESLKANIQRSDVVYVMTDNDHEGDLIAEHVRGLIPRGKESHRIITGSLTTDSVKHAILNPISFRDRNAQGSLARRIFDRICGYHFSKKGIQGNIGIGRVLSPVLAHIAKNPVESNSLVTKTIRVGKDFLSLEVRIPVSSGLNVNSIKRTLDDLAGIDIDCGPMREQKVFPSLLTGNETTHLISKFTDSSIKSVSESMQKLYEKGLISYHRSDSRNITSSGLSSISRVCFESGGKILDTVDARHLVDDHIKQAHEALHITGVSQSINGDFQSLLLEDKVYRLIYRLSESLGTSLIQRECPVVISHPVIDMLKKQGCLIGARFGSVVEAGYNNRSPLSEFPGLCPEISQGVVCHFDPSRSVAETLLRVGLGKQSTFAYHSTKIASDYLDSRAAITFRGFESIQRAIEVSPLILNPERSIEAERILLSSGDIDKSVYDSFYEIGIKDEFMFGKMSKADKSNNKNLDFTI